MNDLATRAEQLANFSSAELAGEIDRRTKADHDSIRRQQNAAIQHRKLQGAVQSAAYVLAGHQRELAKRQTALNGIRGLGIDAPASDIRLHEIRCEQASAAVDAAAREQNAAVANLAAMEAA